MNFTSNFNRLAAKSNSIIEFYSIKNLIPELQEACDYSLFSPGKRLRPVMSLAMAELLEVSDKKIAEFTLALESVHVASLIHDDLPALDNDSLRRGRPTLHVKCGEALALLAGDSLIAEAFLIISKSSELDQNEKVELIRLLSKSFIDICEGQVIDISSESQRNPEILELCHLKKTASLIEAAITGPALISNIKSEQDKINHLKEFSKNLGLLFQITDDILDVVSNAEILGKDVGSDLGRDAQTYVSVYGLDGAKDLAKKHADIALLALNSFSSKAVFFEELLTYILNREK